MTDPTPPVRRFDFLRGYYGVWAYEKRTRRIAARNSVVHRMMATVMNEHRESRAHDALLPLYWVMGAAMASVGGIGAVYAHASGADPAGIWLAAVAASTGPPLIGASAYAFTRDYPESLHKGVTQATDAVTRLAKHDRDAADRAHVALVALVSNLGRPDRFGRVPSQDHALADIQDLTAAINAHTTRAALANAHAAAPLAEHHRERAAEQAAARQQARTDRYLTARTRAAAFTADAESISSDIEWYRSQGLEVHATSAIGQGGAS